MAQYFGHKPSFRGGPSRTGVTVYHDAGGGNIRSRFIEMKPGSDYTGGRAGGNTPPVRSGNGSFQSPIFQQPVNSGKSASNFGKRPFSSFDPKRYGYYDMPKVNVPRTMFNYAMRNPQMMLDGLNGLADGLRALGVDLPDWADWLGTPKSPYNTALTAPDGKSYYLEVTNGLPCSANPAYAPGTTVGNPDWILRFEGVGNVQWQDPSAVGTRCMSQVSMREDVPWPGESKVPYAAEYYIGLYTRPYYSWGPRIENLMRPWYSWVRADPSKPVNVTVVAVQPSTAPAPAPVMGPLFQPLPVSPAVIVSPLDLPVAGFNPYAAHPWPVWRGNLADTQFHQTGPKPAPVPRPAPATGGYKPPPTKPGIIIVGPTPPRPPTHGERERKFKFSQGMNGVFNAARTVFHATTEAKDVIDALWDALPGKVKAAGKGPKTLDKKFMDLYNHIGDIQMDKAIWGLILNHYSDKVIGTGLGKLDRAAKNMGLPSSYRFENITGHILDLRV